MSELTLQEAALAWAQGKRVEASHANSCRWLPIDTAGQRSKRGYSTLVFSDTDYHFRLAPEPPARKFRPFTAEEWEGRLGATLRKKGSPREVRLVGSCVDGVITIAGGGQFTPLAILDGWEFGDGSPCGVEVSE